MTTVTGGGAPPSNSAVGGRSGAASEDAAATGERNPNIPDRTEAIVLGGFAAAAVGVLILKRPVQSKVIGSVGGVELLANPRLPRGADVTWRAPSSGNVFGSGRADDPRVSIEHADQGALPDCWNVAGQGAVAHRLPRSIEQMIDDSGEHIVVHLPERSVAVTRELPMSRSGRPAFAGSGPERVYWAAYLEKAQAAIERDGYRSLEGGVAKRTFQQLLGSNPVRGRSRGSIMDDVEHHLNAKHPIAIATNSTLLTNPALRGRMAKLNIKPNHYYIPVEQVSVNGERRVRLFNPWGEQHPTEPLSERDLRRIFKALDTPDEYIRYGVMRV